MHTVLLVEDEANQRLLYRMELEDEGYRVIEAGTAREAIEKAENERPDLVVLDLRMPVMDGVEALGRLVDLNPRLPVLIHSGSKQSGETFRTQAAVAYVMKSSNVDVLKGELRKVVSVAKARGRWPVWPEGERPQA